MNEEAWIGRRAGGWARLRPLVERASAGLHRLKGDEVLEFVRLYRAASTDLAHARSHSSSRETSIFLNALVSQAHAVLYRRPARRLREAVSSGVREGCSAVRRHAWATWLGLAVFFAGGLASYVVLSLRPDLREVVIAPGMRENFDAWKTGKFDARTAGESVAMTSFYATNNPRAGIALNALAVATFGLGTAYIEWQNGMLVGALAEEMHGVGKLGFLLSSLFPHGVSEIGGFCVTGAGGFVLGWAALAPGRRRRWVAIADAGQDSFRLLAAGLVMIFLAAPIEGFVSFNPAVPQWFKVLFGAAMLAGLVGLVRRYGDSPKASNSPERTARASASTTGPSGASPD
jgi:uncharacterized membrane protein SpoIIM required for sporulation